MNNTYNSVTGKTTTNEAEILLFNQAKKAKNLKNSNFLCFQKILKDVGVDYID